MSGARIAVPLWLTVAAAIAALALGAACPRLGEADRRPGRPGGARRSCRAPDARAAGRGARDRGGAGRRRRRPRQQLSRARPRAQGAGRAGARRQGRGRELHRRQRAAQRPEFRHAASSPASRTTPSASPAPRSATCSCSATSATRCAKARGSPPASRSDELILGLACVGLAITAGTYASLGAGVPARVGLTLVKAARKTGKLTGGMATWIGRSVREIVDVPAAAARARQRVDLSAGRRGAGGARGRQGREVGRTSCSSSATSAGSRARPEPRRRSTGSSSPTDPRDMAKVATPGRRQGRQDPRDPQARRPRRHHADRGHMESRHVDLLGGLDRAEIRRRLLKRTTERSTERYCARRRRQDRDAARASPPACRRPRRAGCFARRGRDGPVPVSSNDAAPIQSVRQGLLRRLDLISPRRRATRRP